ncbi:DUF6114 domain-containing protein [Nonomuraea sp. NPDC049152]|uniref:DUF6114 domain-containing protein n=1 Tax=Nonomuraea sp. NPDC049152 TaxID=3154350 RepID=UPI0033D3054B
MKSWRRSRPFWGGLFVLVAGLELLSIPLAVDALPVAIMFGTVGATYLIAVVMMILGVLVWLQPGQRVFLGLMAVLLSMASFVYSNLGGFLLGMIIGLLGGMLAVAWTPVSRPASRFDTVDVRTVLAAARTILSRMNALSRATTVDFGQRGRRMVTEIQRYRWLVTEIQRCRWLVTARRCWRRLVTARRGRVDEGARPVDADAVAELRKSAR